MCSTTMSSPFTPFAFGRARQYHARMTFAVILLAVVCLAYANGANDNFKGVATLFGSGTWRIDDIYVDPWKVV